MTARCQRAPATHCGVWLTKVLVRLKAMNFDAEGERFSSRLCERRGSEGGTLMDDFNTQLDELQNEINGLRSDLDDLRDRSGDDVRTNRGGDIERKQSKIGYVGTDGGWEKVSAS